MRLHVYNLFYECYKAIIYTLCFVVFEFVPSYNSCKPVLALLHSRPTPTYTNMHNCTCSRTHTHTHTHTHAHKHTHMHADAHTLTRATHTHTHLHTRLITHAHKNTHTARMYIIVLVHAYV